MERMLKTEPWTPSAKALVYGRYIELAEEPVWQRV